MRNRLVHALALLILLTQTGLGSVAGVSVICFSQGLCGPAETPTKASTCSSHSTCCAVEMCPTQQQQVIRLAVPCDADCTDCVDVELPNVEIAVLDRSDLPLIATSLEYSTAGVINSLRCGHPARLLPPATGPPELRACPHAPVVRATRLLI